MFFCDNLPNSMVSQKINNILLEEALVERICLESFTQIPSRINNDTIKWLFIVGIYKSKDMFYLLLDANDKSSAIDDMLENGTFPNTGLVQISKETAMVFTKKLSELGKEYFKYSFPGFQKIISLLTSAIPCRVTFEPRFNEGGHYDRVKKEIVIANNSSQFCMIVSLVHEYVHHLLNSDRIPPETWKEYLVDIDEYVCNSVAAEIISVILGFDFIKRIIENEIPQFLQVQNDLFKRNIASAPLVASPEALFYLDLHYRKEQLKTNLDIQAIVDSLVDKIISKMCSLNPESIEMRTDCSQIGLVKLSFDDNRILYNMIVKELSSLMPKDIFDD